MKYHCYYYYSTKWILTSTIFFVILWFLTALKLFILLADRHSMPADWTCFTRESLSEEHQICDTNPPSWDDTQPEVRYYAPLSLLFLLSSRLFVHWTLPHVLFRDAFDYISATVNRSAPAPTGISWHIRTPEGSWQWYATVEPTPAVLTVHSGIWKTRVLFSFSLLAKTTRLWQMGQCSVTKYALEIPLIHIYLQTTNIWIDSKTFLLFCHNYFVNERKEHHETALSSSWSLWKTAATELKSTLNWASPFVVWRAQ